MKRLPCSILLSISILLVTGCNPGAKKPGEKDELLIATASSMHYVMQPLLEAFTRETNIPCKQITGSSGKLSAQILSGAPFDIFLSADMAYPINLHKNGYGVDAPTTFAYGRMVLWSLDKKDLQYPQGIFDPGIRHIALANPETAPYGKAAMQVLERHEAWKPLQSKFVFGESVAQVNQFISSGGAEIGFTAEAVVRAPGLRDEGFWISIPEEHHTPIAQGIILLKNGNAGTQSQQSFRKFLAGPQARSILRTYGYEIPTVMNKKETP